MGPGCSAAHLAVESTVERRWIFPPPLEAASVEIPWTELCGSDCIARLLQRKGFASRENAEGFLRPRLKTLGDPFLIPNMKAAVDRIFHAIDAQQRIVVFGDYDVDGVASLALLADIMRAYGANPTLFLPLRMEEGYGLSAESVARCYAAYQPELLIAIDCGTSSIAEIADLKARGTDVVVIDHHEPKSALPDCIAIVNPKASGNEFAYFCSAGLAFKVSHAMLKTRPLTGFDLKAQLDLVALATVADIVPLHRENRTLVHRGVIELARTRRPGLRELMQVSGVRSPVQAEHIGFRLGPRLNAAGRLATAERALKLLLTNDEGEARSLAVELDTSNRERQGVEKKITIAAEEQVAQTFDPDRDAAIVLGARDWHPGVLGIVASRMTKKYHRPTIVVGFDETGVGKGSGRSVDGLSIVAALSRCSALLEKFGGHEMAAGLTIRETVFEDFRAQFRDAVRALVTDDQLQPRLAIDDEIEFRDLHADFLGWHDLLQPFGNGNAQPIFCVRGVELAGPTRVASDRHLILRLKQGRHYQRAVFFDGAAEKLPTPPWDIAFRVHADEYQGERRLDMHIQAIRAAESKSS